MAIRISGLEQSPAAQVPGLSIVRFILSEDERNPQVEREARLPALLIMSSFTTASHPRSQRVHGSGCKTC